MDVRNAPRTAEVTVLAPGLRTPRIDMHRCSHSTTTMTPRGSTIRGQRIGDLAGQPFLNLRPPRVEVDQTRQLRQPGDLALLVRDVADVGHPVKRHQVVLAGASRPRCPDHDHLVVPGVEDGGKHVFGPLAQPGELLRVRPGDARRRLLQAFAVGSSPIASRISRTAASIRRRGRAVGDRSATARTVHRVSPDELGPPASTSRPSSWPGRRAAVATGPLRAWPAVASGGIASSRGHDRRLSDGLRLP